MGNTLVSLFCIVATILFIMMLGYLSNRGKKKNEGNATRPTNKKPGWRDWIWHVIIALLLAFWSVVFALFFLAIVWVMRLDPKVDSKEIPFPSDKDRKRAKGTYTWLLLSPFLNVFLLVLMSINLSSRSSANERVVAALVPLLFHLPILMKLDPKGPFVFRHTQQAIFLLAIRASMAAIALNIGSYPEDGILLFLFGNGFLWLVGSIWGLNQVNHDTGWWIGRKGEKVLTKDAIPTEKPVSRDKTERPIPNEELGDLLKSLNAEGNNARQKALNAFRAGTPETRKKAVTVLSKLGEVEKF